MKKIMIFVAVMFLFFVTISVSAADFSGFVQARVDSNNFSIKGLRAVVKGPVETGVSGIGVTYDVHFYLDSKGVPTLGNAVINFDVGCSTQLMAGRMLDPMNYQLFGPTDNPTLNYQSAFMNVVYGTGLFATGKYGDLWFMAGVTNGTGEIRDDNKSMDVTGRVTYDWLGVTWGAVYRQGRQIDGDRRMLGADLTWSVGDFVLNGGCNQMDYIDLKTAGWLTGVYDCFSWLQLAGMLDLMDEEAETGMGYSFCLSLAPSAKSVIRIGHYKTVYEEEYTGVLFQMKF